MAGPILYTAYCPRCNRGFRSTTPEKAVVRMEKHVKKHPDYVPELHNEQDD